MTFPDLPGPVWEKGIAPFTVAHCSPKALWLCNSFQTDLFLNLLRSWHDVLLFEILAYLTWPDKFVFLSRSGSENTWVWRVKLNSAPPRFQSVSSRFNKGRQLLSDSFSPQ